jgi:hypothetical protein
MRAVRPTQWTTRSAVIVVAALVTASAAGCGRKQPKGTAAGRDAGGGGASGVDAGVTVLDWTDAPAEATLRQGKRTGLGGPDEPAEVATEPLIEALVAGRVPWTRWIDPARGVVELRLPADASGAVARRCGAGLTAALDALVASMRAATAGALGYTLECDNLGLFAADPDGALAAAVCSLESTQPGTLIIDLVFVPDDARGLRLVGLSTVPADADATDALEAFEPAMAADARCP